MKITLENTDRMVTINGNTPARVWEGETSTGIKVIALISRVAIPGEICEEVVEQFNRELSQEKEPSNEAIRVFPLRLVI